MEDFFKENKEYIEKFKKHIENLNKENKFYNDLKLCINFLNDIEKPAMKEANYSRNCQFNIQLNGNTFLDDIRNIEKNNEIYESIITFLLKIAKEYEITSNYPLSLFGRDLIENFSKPSEGLSEFFNDQIHYTFSIMPYNIIKWENRNQLEKLINNFEKKIDDTLDEKLPTKKQEVEKFQNYIDNIIKQLGHAKQEFSFVSLNKAFFDLAKSKKIAKYITITLLFLLGIIIVYIPYYYYEKTFLIKNISDAFNLSLEGKNNLPLFILLSGFIPMFFIESIFIYFFRIVLHKYNSITDQIVQLETKQAIIQFIESYVDYKKEKKLNKDELIKFENIIFSKLSPNLKDVPDLPNLITLVDNLSKIIKNK